MAGTNMPFRSCVDCGVPLPRGTNKPAERCRPCAARRNGKAKG